MNEEIPSGLETDPEVSAKRTAAMQQMTERSRSDREKLAAWMIEHGFATGHGDSIDDLLKELSWQVAELRDQIERFQTSARWLVDPEL